MKEIKAHTGLRGVAAVTVLISHLQLVSPHIHPWMNILGGPAVDLFFMLSGFIMCYVYHREGESKPRGGWWAYAVARFARIYPLYLAVLLAFGLYYIFWGLPWGRVFGKHFWPQFFGFFAWPWVFSPTINPAAWSVSIEVFCYIFIFPLTLLVRPAFRRPWLYVPVIYAITAVVVWYVAYTPGSNLLEWKAVARGVTGFFTGFVLYQIYHHHPNITRWAQRLVWVSVLAAAALITGFFYAIPWISVWMLLLVWPTLVLGVSGDNNGMAWLLSTRVARFFGEISFGLYLIHLPVMMAISLADAGSGRVTGYGGGWVVTLIAPVILTLVSWLSYRFLETPAREWLRALLGRTRRDMGTQRPSVV